MTLTDEQIDRTLKLASGIADIPKMHKAGMIIALGTDGCSSNNNLDLIMNVPLNVSIEVGKTKKKIRENKEKTRKNKKKPCRRRAGFFVVPKTGLEPVRSETGGF